MTNITQCPNCSSVFAISDEQFSASKGNVRCGACREKFNVVFLSESDNMVLNTKLLAEKARDETNESPHGQIELLRILSEHAKQEELELNKQLLFQNQIANTANDEVHSEQVFTHDDSQTSIDDLFANSFSESISTSFVSEYSNSVSLAITDQSTHTFTLHDDNLLSDELLDEVDALIEHKIIGDESHQVLEAELTEDDFTLKPSWQSTAKTTIGSITLMLIGLILLCGLAYQLWLKQALPEAFIKPISTIVPVIDPLIGKITTQYDITLPVRTDLNNLQLVSAHTEAHPSRASTLLLRVSFLNNSKIAQPLPDLELSLTDEDGRVVSRRTFAPVDYLYNNDTENIISSNELKKVTVELLAFPKQAHGYELKIVD